MSEQKIFPGHDFLDAMRPHVDAGPFTSRRTGDGGICVLPVSEAGGFRRPDFAVENVIEAAHTGLEPGK